MYICNQRKRYGCDWIWCREFKWWSNPISNGSLWNEKYYTRNQSTKKFILRKQGHPVPGYTGVYSTEVTGRIYSVRPSNYEYFYLRLLLVNVRGPTSFKQLRTVDGELCWTYIEGCHRLGLDQTDAVISSPSHQIRTLLCVHASHQNQLISAWNTKIILFKISEEIYNQALISVGDNVLNVKQTIMSIGDDRAQSHNRTTVFINSYYVNNCMISLLWKNRFK